MTRSDKEIKERITFLKSYGDSTGLICLEFQEAVKWLKWCLEGEPRYSVEELEKIAKYTKESNDWLEVPTKPTHPVIPATVVRIAYENLFETLSTSTNSA